MPKVIGNKDSCDLARDVRGFAVKFYTKEGNWDIVGNDIPAFAHCKFIGYTAAAEPLIVKAGIAPDRYDEGMVLLESASDAPAFLAACGQLRLWDRELKTDLDAAAFLETA
jgi:hypothetical protein